MWFPTYPVYQSSVSVTHYDRIESCGLFSSHLIDYWAIFGTPSWSWLVLIILIILKGFDVQTQNRAAMITAPKIHDNVSPLSPRPRLISPQCSITATIYIYIMCMISRLCNYTFAESHQQHTFFRMMRMPRGDLTSRVYIYHPRVYIFSPKCCLSWSLKKHFPAFFPDDDDGPKKKIHWRDRMYQWSDKWALYTLDDERSNFSFLINNLLV